jgi:hypothetical protein
MHLDQYDRIREGIAARGLTPEMETRIAIFVAASKAVNLPFLSLASAAPGMPFGWAALGSKAPSAETGATGAIAWQALNTQFFHESEALTLLLRVTRWSPDPLVYARSVPLVAPLYAESMRVGFKGLPRQGEAIGIEALALGHALLATVRLTPILPDGPAGQTPFAVALMRIEQENGRLVQTQIRILKDGYADIPIKDREAVIARKAALVEAAFDRFLDSLAA